MFLPAGWAHSLSPLALKIYSRIYASEPKLWKSFSWRHIHFPNPLGTAGGVDKNALYIKDWWLLGAGFLEVGTVSPLAQEANPPPILNRSLKHLSLWNNMGFPNNGMDFVRQSLSRLSEKKTPIFVNIGKNRQTPLSTAVQDYEKSISALHTFADVFVINISSPNTKDLRKIFSQQELSRFLKSLKDLILSVNPKIPLILKLSPDEDEENIIRIIEQSIESEIDGWCICNSTRERSIPHLFPKEGGVSGQLLAKSSLSLLKTVSSYLKDNGVEDKLIISCGGVLTFADVLERLNAGAQLVQVYSALVFKGPGFFQSVFKEYSQSKI